MGKGNGIYVRQNRIPLLPMLLCGAATAIGCLAVRYLGGDPYEKIHLYGMQEYLPPVKLLSCLWLLWHFLLGLAAGWVLFGQPKLPVAAYRGGMYFLLMLGAGYFFYPCFFTANARFLAFLLLAVALFFAVLCIADWFSLCAGAGVAIGLYAVWLVYLLILVLNLLIRL